LAFFISHGAAAWIRANLDEYRSGQAGWSKPQSAGQYASLVILLANMIES
jgi:hypothetical protein